MTVHRPPVTPVVRWTGGSVGLVAGGPVRPVAGGPVGSVGPVGPVGSVRQMADEPVALVY